jgi:hypothetical protein
MTVLTTALMTALMTVSTTVMQSLPSTHRRQRRASA